MFEHGLDAAHWLVSWIPSARWRDVIALPLLIALLLIAFGVLIRLLPVVDRILRLLGGGLATVAGLLLLLPEYLTTMLLRRAGRSPWGLAFAYGDAVEHTVLAGRRLSAAGLAGFFEDRSTRRWLMLAALLVTVLWGNFTSCPATTDTCTRPITVWWQQTSTVFSDRTPDEAPPRKPAKPTPTKKPAKKDS
ncbi:hypothetical protein [Luedemannella helvata]|uniref:RDD domain-containing protein n=1 Tax=Luedemannella helvata TaxID=349315 RepID=A0ABP4VX28_9ACTN